jgi:hypothetical protein
MTSFRAILARVTGLQAGGWGASWKPAEADVMRARRVISFLENRRVLYCPTELELPGHCIQSVFDIRRFLDDELQRLPMGREIEATLKALRADCRKFTSRLQDPHHNVLQTAQSHRQLSGYDSWIFGPALGEPRGVFGVHIALVAARFHLDVGAELVSILPSRDLVTDSESQWRAHDDNSNF